MAMSFKIDTTEIENWVNNQPVRDRAKKIALMNIKDYLVNETADQTSKISSSGRLESSIQGRTDSKSVKIYALGYGDIALEYGRRPGKMPPLQPLKEWAGRTLGNENLGYVVARKIAREGTQKYRNQGPKQLTLVMEKFKSIFETKEVNKLLDEYVK